ncbi:MAG: hypothetical protein M1829_005379 [Trizodia sp. TS-e1964]|nr:MAG: hypothetical protein M1829_005379 [Trizodia sp. TS-e1964]
MSVAKVLTTTITSTVTKAGRVIDVGYVKSTDMWWRTMLDTGVQSEFKGIVEKNIATLGPHCSVVNRAGDALQSHRAGRAGPDFLTALPWQSEQSHRGQSQQSRSVGSAKET